MQTNREWLSIADMMSGLMMVFLFIALVFMIQSDKERNAMKEIAETYTRLQMELYEDLKEEFHDDLRAWGAELLKNNTIRFNEPDILFSRSSSKINMKFMKILDDFFPRYVKVITKEKYKKEIEEVRIEGHTSSIWRLSTSREEAYLKNASLSQDRSFSVLSYVYMIPQVETERDWLIKVLRANGLSFAKIIYDDKSEEDLTRSRRVEIRVITKAENKIRQILEKANI